MFKYLCVQNSSSSSNKWNKHTPALWNSQLSGSEETWCPCRRQPESNWKKYHCFFDKILDMDQLTIFLVSGTKKKRRNIISEKLGRKLQFSNLLKLNMSHQILPLTISLLCIDINRSNEPRNTIEIGQTYLYFIIGVVIVNHHSHTFIFSVGQ